MWAQAQLCRALANNLFGLVAKDALRVARPQLGSAPQDDRLEIHRLLHGHLHAGPRQVGRDSLRAQEDARLLAQLDIWHGDCGDIERLRRQAC
eukprot:8692363-Alexandrium_andersonii.AAC.1